MEGMLIMANPNASTVKAYPRTKIFLRKIQAKHMEKFGTKPSYERILVAIERLFEFYPDLYMTLINKELK